MKNLNNKRKYLLIGIIFAFIIIGGIFGYRYWLTQKERGKEIKIPSETKIPKEQFVEMSLEELKEGENRIGDIIVEKIKPQLLCKIGNPERWEGEYPKWSDERYELICNIENKAKIKMIGGHSGLREFLIIVQSFSVFDKNNNLVDERGKEEFYEFYEDEGKVKIFDYNNKIYFLVSGGTYGMKTGISHYFLYVIDENENVKFIDKWSDNLIECETLQRVCGLDYGIGYKQNLYLKIGGEIWEFDADDILKNKFPANKIKIQDDKIYFE